MTWKDLLSEPNTRVTVVRDGTYLEDELEKAVRTIDIVEELYEEETVPVAVKTEAFVKESGECEEDLFPIIWGAPMKQVLTEHFCGVKLCSEEYIAVKATIVFPNQSETQYILLVCESEMK